MMHLYSALMCIVVHPKRFTIMWGGGGVSLLNHHHTDHVHLDDATAATGQQHQCAHQLQVETRESHRASQVDGDY